MAVSRAGRPAGSDLISQPGDPLYDNIYYFVRTIMTSGLELPQLLPSRDALPRLDGLFVLMYFRTFVVDTVDNTPAEDFGMLMHFVFGIYDI